MSAETPNHLDLQPAEPSVAEQAFMDRLDAWSRGELHDLRSHPGPGGLPGAMVEDMRRVRLMRSTVIGAAIVVLAMLMIIVLLITNPLSAGSRDGSAPVKEPVSSTASSDDSIRPTRAGATPPTVRQLQRMNPELAVEELVLPDPAASASAPSRSAR